MAAAGLLLVTYLAPWVSPKTCYPLALLAIGYPCSVLLNVFFLSCWAFARRREAWLSLTAVLLGAPYLLCYVGVHPPGPSPPSCIRLMTFNAKYFRVTAGADRVGLNVTARAVINLLTDQKPAIFCAQDFSGDGNVDKPIESVVDHQLGLHNCYIDSPSLYTFTGYPMGKQHAFTFPDSMNSFSYADVKLPAQTIRVFNLHLQSYGIGVLPGEKSGPREILARLRRGLLMRGTQAEMVANTIESSPYPVVVCGDFNDVPLSYVYHVISRGLKDGFSSAGWGSGVTYSGPFPLQRIDHILCSPVLRIWNYRILPFPYSDHRPGVCDLEVSLATWLPAKHPKLRQDWQDRRNPLYSA